MKKVCIHIFLSCCCIAAAIKINAQPADTLTNVKVFSKKEIDITGTPASVQQLNKTDLEKLNSVSVADAAKYFSGVVIKDYGGIGGLKTVSVRSLGANHTAVMYDGIVIGDAQGGQIDLGRLSLDNIQSIQLYSNQPADILIPARSYASASVLALSSLLNNNKERSVTLKLKAGSFGFFNPAFSYKSPVGKNMMQALSAEYQSADGSYHFIDYETGRGRSKRNNAGIKAYRIEYDAAYFISDSNRIKLKLYYYHSKRGLPGAVILYNNISDERLYNASFFAQANWQKNFSAKSRLLISGKFSADHKYYIDPSYPNSFGKLENDFYQNELFFSAAYSYKLFNAVTISYASDYFRSTLKRKDQFAQDFANPTRENFLNSISAQFKKKRIEMFANLLHTAINEKVENGDAGKRLRAFSPAVAASVQVFENFPVRIRASYKKIFRAPTFDDLYYTNIGNTLLRPEYVDQYSVGVTYNYQSAGFIKTMMLTVDGYFNKAKDKIFAAPQQNLFQWTMLNIGRSDAKGIDAAAHIDLKQWRKTMIALRLSYSYQDARDMSDPSLASYKQQIPYTPVHSGSASLSVLIKEFSIAYNILASSYRYKLGDPIPQNVVQGFTTHDISVGYDVLVKSRRYKFLAEANNIFNTQYEIIRYYPMPRFNYRVGLIVSFNK